LPRDAEFVLQPAALLRPFIAALSSTRVFFDVRLQPRQSVVPLLGYLIEITPYFLDRLRFELK
jgi:hypothetical protein